MGRMGRMDGTMGKAAHDPGRRIPEFHYIREPQQGKTYARAVIWPAPSTTAETPPWRPWRLGGSMKRK